MLWSDRLLARFMVTMYLESICPDRWLIITACAFLAWLIRANPSSSPLEASVFVVSKTPTLLDGLETIPLFLNSLFEHFSGFSLLSSLYGESECRTCLSSGDSGATSSFCDVLAFNSMSFSSVTQCGPFNVSFVGGKAPSAMPLTLTLTPFNSTNPLSIPVARDTWNAKTSTGAAVTFLPFAAGMMFVASVDDANGVGAGPVSDIIKILPSANSSCLPSNGNTSTSTPPYTLNGTLSQCLPFNMSYNSTTTSAPTIRAFSPKGPSFFVNSTGVSSGMATYVMTAQRGEEVVLLFDDGRGNRQTTDLMTVGGDSSSPTNCIQNQIGSVSPASQSTSKQGLSNGTIVGIVAGSVTVVGFISTLLIMFIYGERRRRLGKVRQFANLESQGGSDGQEKGEVPQMTANLPPVPTSRPTLSVVVPSAPKPTPRASRFARGNTFSDTADAVPPTAMSPEFIDYRDRGSELSPWTQSKTTQRLAGTGSTPDSMPLPGSLEDQRELSTTPHPSHDQPELDIDQILDMATMYTLSPMTDNPPAQPFTPATISSHDHYHAPSDVPVGAEHMSMFYTSVLYPAGQTPPASGEGSGQQSVNSAPGGARESMFSSSLAPVEIATATRAATAVARVARVDP